MPTLLQINVASNWGSIGKIAEQIGLCAQAHGWTSYVAYARMNNPSRNRLIKIGSMADVYEHYAESRLLDNEGLASRRATRRLLREVDRIKPDIVQLHDLHDHYMNYPLLFRYLSEKRIPVVWTQHDQWATTGHCPYNVKGCERWATECHDCPMSRWYQLDRSRRNFRLKKRWFAAVPSLTVVSVSEWLAANLRRSLLGNRPIEVIHNGIDLDTFRPQAVDLHKLYGLDRNKIVALGVSSVWNSDKGLEDLVQLSRKPGITVVIAGLSRKQIRELKSAEYKDCSLVPIARTQNQQELAELYTMADVFVNPTYADMFPSVNLEALACGTPVVTYRTGGSPEAIDSATGCVVETGDLKAMAAAINQLHRHPLSPEACRRRAERLFDKDRCFERYIELYERLLHE